jgi:uncharacterized protein
MSVPSLASASFTPARAGWLLALQKTLEAVSKSAPPITSSTPSTHPADAFTKEEGLKPSTRPRARRFISGEKFVADWARLLSWGTARLQDTKHTAFMATIFVATSIHSCAGSVPGVRQWLEGKFISGRPVPPARLSESSELLRNEYHLQDVQFPGKDGNNMYAWYVPAQEGKPTFLFTPGRIRKLKRFNTLMEAMAKRGYGVFIYELRSYGHNKGAFSEKATQKDFLAASQYLCNTFGVKVKQQIPFGWSLGGAITAQGAQRRGFPAVVLCSTFTHMNAMSEHLKDTFNLPKHWFKNPSLTQPFDSISHVQKATAPTLVLHGTEDPEVPLLFAEQLYNEVNLPAYQKQFEVFAGEPHYIDPEALMDRTERFLHRQGVV